MFRQENRFTYMLAMALAIFTLVSLTACGHTHKWEDATCSAPKTCVGCGETEGEKLTHIPGEEGKCTLCGWAMNITVPLDGLKHIIAPTVFGGVRFSTYLVTGAENTALLKEYTVYDASGNLLAKGTFSGVMKFKEYGVVDNNVPMKHYYYTEYHPLSPGTYTVEYSYYKTFDKQIVASKQLVFWEPTSELSQGVSTFTVK